MMEIRNGSGENRLMVCDDFYTNFGVGVSFLRRFNLNKKTAIALFAKVPGKSLV